MPGHKTLTKDLYRRFLPSVFAAAVGMTGATLPANDAGARPQTTYQTTRGEQLRFVYDAQERSEANHTIVIAVEYSKTLPEAAEERFKNGFRKMWQPIDNVYGDADRTLEFMFRRIDVPRNVMNVAVVTDGLIHSHGGNDVHDYLMSVDEFKAERTEINRRYRVLRHNKPQLSALSQ